MLNNFFPFCLNSSLFSVLCDINSIVHFSNLSLLMLFSVLILFFALCACLQNLSIEHILNLDSLNYWSFLKLVVKSFK